MNKQALACAAIAACGSVASAQFTVMLTDSASITEDGQMFTFTFDMLPGAISAGSLTIDALGDYSVVPPSTETMDWDIDGIASGQGFEADAFSGPVDLFQNAVSQSWNISESDMAAITADGTLTITIQNAGSVGTFPDQPDDFVSVYLEYRAVPAPASAGLLALGGLVAARRRR